MDRKNNPLLLPFDTPYQTAPFHLIRPEHFEPAVREKIKQAKNQLKQIIRDQSKPSFQNTLIPLEKEYDELSRIGLILYNLNTAGTNVKLQFAIQKISPLITRFMSRALINKKLFRRIETIYLNSENEHLSAEELHLLETTFNSMKRNGAGLHFTKKLKLIDIQLKLSKLTLSFNENVLAETNDFELHIDQIKDLAGIPATEINIAAQTAKEKNKTGYIFTLQYPSYSSFLKYANNRSLREIVYKAYASRGNCGNKKDNKKLIRKIVNLRLKQANLLGYKHYAEYILEERMAKSANAVYNFLNELHIASQPFAKAEMTELKHFANKLGFSEKLMPWDLSYYSEKLKTEKFGFNEEMIKPYFQLNNVIEGVFHLGTRLYGLSFKAVSSVPVYHPNVKTYEVYNEQNEFLAILYADFHPRENKQSGAWMTEYLAQSNIDGCMIRPHISICCNFSKPAPNKPALLTFSEVNTFLHEFGHALHGMLANTVYPSLSGTNVYRDFVELPSQILENWLTEMEWLEQFAIHYETGQPIPKQLIEKLIAARNFQAGYQSERQLMFCSLDMAWHTLETPFKANVKQFELEHTASFNLMPNITNACISTSFSHIFSGGYAAGYYGYKWAEVLDADAFSAFKKGGIFNRELAFRFRKEILEKGGTSHPMNLYKNFRGKAPANDALLKRSGLIKTTHNA